MQLSPDRASSSTWCLQWHANNRDCTLFAHQLNLQQQVNTKQRFKGAAVKSNSAPRRAVRVSATAVL